MANSSLQAVGLVLSVIAAVCTTLAVILPEWRKNDPKGEVIEAVVRHQGIWLRCTSYSTGIWQCDDFDAFFLGLPAQLQVARGLALCSVVFGFFGIMLSIFGMECTRCIENNPKTKTRIALIASGFFIASALSIGIAVSYYASQVAQEYTASSILLVNDLGQRYVFGSSLFLGWAAMAIGVLGGAVMMCGSFYVDKEEDEYWNKGRVGRGVRRMRSSFRQSFRPRVTKDADYV
uniref:Claudin-1 n=1 Tax=Ciona intestinalis TaxID=7719 RepID=F6PX91_CIOIN|nr:claudin-1 [Ciona intestinalis]|eukprot:XP_002120514.1 claudin-1 [Ciona intestinalis]